MALSKYKIGELIELFDERNFDNEFNSVSDIQGVNNMKQFQPYKAIYASMELSSYRKCRKGMFACNKATSRNGEKISIAYRTGKDCLVSPSYYCFRVKNEDILLPLYLNLFFSRPEFDRYTNINSWGSATEFFSWEEMCSVEITLPSLDIQQKYVDVYNAMLANQQTYERGLEDLKLVCDGYIEDLRRNMPCEKIGGYIEERNFKNSGNKIKEVRSVSVTKEFKLTNAKVNKNELSNYLVVQPKEIAFVQTTGNEKVLAFAYNNYNYPVVVSSVDKVFCSKNENVLDLQYLSLFLSRKEFDRYARFNSWGSARETFTFEDMKEVEIPIPDIEIQKSIVSIYKCYNERKRINEQLKAQIKDICPILIKGSIEEGRKD